MWREASVKERAVAVSPASVMKRPTGSSVAVAT
jgi:hypothetical protein